MPDDDTNPVFARTVCIFHHSIAPEPLYPVDFCAYALISNGEHRYADRELYTFARAQSPQPAPQSMKAETKKTAPAKFEFAPKGGETTAAEKKELAEIFKAKFPDGSPVFSKDAMKFFSDLRKDFTAREVIERARAERDKRLNPTATMSKASELPEPVEAVKKAFDGEVVSEPAAEPQHDEIF